MIFYDIKIEIDWIHCKKLYNLKNLWYLLILSSSQFYEKYIKCLNKIIKLIIFD